MKNHVMTMNYSKSFKRIVILFVILAVVTAVEIPLSLSQQISDAAMLKQQYAAMELKWYNNGCPAPFILRPFEV